MLCKEGIWKGVEYDSHIEHIERKCADMKLMIVMMAEWWHMAKVRAFGVNVNEFVEYYRRKILA